MCKVTKLKKGDVFSFFGAQFRVVDSVQYFEENCVIPVNYVAGGEADFDVLQGMERISVPKKDLLQLV